MCLNFFVEDILRWFAYVSYSADRQTWPCIPRFCFECRRTSPHIPQYHTELAIQVSLKMYLELEKKNTFDKFTIFLIKMCWNLVF
jgi:hypothetical protein